MADPAKSDFDKEPAKREYRSRMPGFLVLGIIFLICVVAAYCLSGLMIPRDSRDSGIFTAPPEQQPAPETLPPAENPQPVEPEAAPNAETEFPVPTREGIEATNAQIRGLGEIVDSITSYRLAEGAYPRAIDDVIRNTGLTLPENPFNPDAQMLEVAPGDFYPGGFSYIPFYSRREGPIEGFVLLGYSDRRDVGTTIVRPADMVWPSIFDPPIEVPLPGVAVAMGDGRELIDISDFGDRTGESEDAL